MRTCARARTRRESRPRFLACGRPRTRCPSSRPCDACARRASLRADHCGRRAVAIQANLVHRLAQLRVISGAVHVVAIEARDAAAVHHALHEIVSLHAILVRGAVGKMRESQLAQRVIFQLPVILQIQPHVIADRPVVVFPFDRIAERPPLRVALDAGVAGADVVHARGIQDVVARGMFRHARCPARGSARSRHSTPRLVSCGCCSPPNGSRRRWARWAAAYCREDRRPSTSRVPLAAIYGRQALWIDVPLRRLRKVVVADFREVALLPDASVDESDLVLRELRATVLVARFGMIASGCSRGSRTTLAIGVFFQCS